RPSRGMRTTSCAPSARRSASSSPGTRSTATRRTCGGSTTRRWAPCAPPRPRVAVGGVIHTVKLRNSKKGDRYATFVIEDREGVVEVIAWPDTYRKHEPIVRSGAPVVIAGALEISAERCQIIAEEVTPLAEARADAISQVHVHVEVD